MLRHIAAILLLIAFSAHTFQSTFIVFDYYANTESFARRCINKMRPSMNCNGKCLLMKKLKEQEKKEQQAPERKMDIKVDYAYTRSLFILKPIEATVVSHYHFSRENLLHGHCDNIFHPPSVA